jgi:2'-hydroxyisoflavone reductase
MTTTDDRSTLNRRDLLRGAAGGAVLVGAGVACSGGGNDRSPAAPAAPVAPAPETPPPTTEKKKPTLLILGGTGFLGPAIVEAAQARGHTITLFNRGKTNPHLFPDVEKLHGDRDGKLQELEGRTWDAVVDTSGYVPRVVKMSADLLAGATKHYVFISTISVYKDMDRPNADETAPLATMPDPTSEEVPQFYGALKALSEQAAEASMPGRVTSIRPGLIVGPRDPTGRFTYWPVRLERGGEILAPGSGADPVQLIDVRDLAEWIVHVVEQRTMGIFNAIGPTGGLPMRDFLAQVAAGAGVADPRFTWVDAAFLEKEKVSAWADLPVWIPAEGETAGVGTTSNARALAAGLRIRRVDDTTRATLEWLRGLDEAERAKVTRGGLAPERETQVLAKWHARKGKAKAKAPKKPK